MKTISKSSYCSGLQCLKKLWLKTNCPEEEQISESAQNVFNNGHTVGNYAKKYFGEYIEVHIDFGNFNQSFPIAQEVTKSHIHQGTPVICEAAFGNQNTLCFVDILRVHSDGSVEIIEVKQSTGLKPQYLDDMAFQYYVITQCGYRVSKISLMYIDKTYVRRGEIEPQELFKIDDCTQEVLLRQNDIPEKIVEMLQYSAQKDEPEMEAGAHCYHPYTCAYLEYCRKVETTNEEKSKQNEAEEGIITFNKEAIRNFLSGIQYPLYFFDFETTCMEPLPPVDEASPYYPPIPFQYSLHIQKTKNDDIDTLEHREFLADEFSNQSVRALAEQLCRDIPKDAMVMAYNMTFEKGVIAWLANAFPDLEEHLLSIYENFIDLMKPFRSRYLQTPEMEGRYSLKLVLPALAPDLDYEELEVQNGEMAYNTFKTLPDLSPEKRNEKRNDLLAYCKLDTYAMVRILRDLEDRCSE